MVVSAAVIGLVGRGGGNDAGSGKAPVANGGAALVHGLTVRLPRGRSATTFTLTAPARRAYDLRMVVPAGPAIVVTMKISPGVGWTVKSSTTPGCHTSGRHAECLLHFAEGGNPGGTWIGTVHKTEAPATLVHLNITFASHAGEYPG